MLRSCFACLAVLSASAAGAQALPPPPVLAAPSQAELDARYDRALAAGYKALMLCSAIANAERAGGARLTASVEAWELAGIQAPLDRIVGTLPYTVTRSARGAGAVRSVAVEWAEAMPPRIAIHNAQAGCSLLPIGSRVPPVVATQPQRPRPGPSAAIVDPVSALGTPLEGAFSARYGDGVRTSAVLVQRGGRVLGERYAVPYGPDVPQRTWSVAKSIAATLVGAAAARGEVTVAQSANLGLSRVGDPRRAITIDDTLRMASGRYSDTPGNRTDPLYYGGATVAETAAVTPLLYPPGTVFRYANNDILMAVRAIAPTFAAHPPAALFATLGMDDTVAETDWQGEYVLSSQVWSTARDLVRLGQLYLQGGVWAGQRILPVDWPRYVSMPDGPQPDGPFGYGAGFWLMNRSDGVPADTYAMFGNRGQYVVIVPSRQMVIVRRGEDPAGARFDIAGFTRDVIAAVE